MQTDTRTQWVAVLSAPPSRRVAAEEFPYIGDGRDVLLQGFHWGSHAGVFDAESGQPKSWYRMIRENVAAIRAAGFTWVWFPPPSDSLAPQGYIPRRWHVLDSAYGSEAELRAAIGALRPVRAMADVVLNHRVGVATAGADFEDPPFPDNRAAIAGDDESGVGTGNPDSGERHPAGRDLDHNNPDVRAAVKGYLRRLRAAGFRGWRYDLVKGYHGRFISEYNEATAPGLSVGECYDGDRQKVTDWVDSASGKSMAFDFPLRFLLYDALVRDDFTRLRSWNVGKAVPRGLLGFWPSRAVTFLDNHDTEYRRESPGSHHDGGVRHFPGTKVEQGYAYLLTHPGVPCVFWSHYFEWGAATRQQLDRLICLRKQAGLHASSAVEIREARHGLYAAVVDGRVAVKLGSHDWHPGHGWQLVADGERFAVWASERGRRRPRDFSALPCQAGGPVPHLVLRAANCSGQPRPAFCGAAAAAPTGAPGQPGEEAPDEDPQERPQAPPRPATVLRRRVSRQPTGPAPGGGGPPPPQRQHRKEVNDEARQQR